MIAYLTSHIGVSYKKNGTRIPTQLSTENGLLDSLKKHWKDNSKVLIISADPDDIEVNDSIMNIFAASYPMSGLSISQMYKTDTPCWNDRKSIFSQTAYSKQYSYRRTTWQRM